MEKLVKCKACGNEMAKSTKTCPSCGGKNKKPFYTKWWFWLIIVIVVVAMASSGGEMEKNSGSSQTEGSKTTEETVVYEICDLKTMIDDLKSNALKAETKYQGKYVEVSGKISNFDSDGKYISIKPTKADEWNFDSAMCYIKNDEQKSFLLEKSIDDVVSIKGKVKSIGEVFGYSIDIIEVQ